MLRRVMMLIALLVLFAVSGAAADLVSMKLCPAKDYDKAARECANGKGLEGSGIQIDPTKIGTVAFLTAVKTTQSEDIYHVWIHGKSLNNVMFYDTATRMLRYADNTELAWLKERNIIGARVIIKMTADASDRFRLRSSKTVTPSMTGAWKVQVYDSTETKPLGEMEFMLGAVAKAEEATN